MINRNEDAYNEIADSFLKDRRPAAVDELVEKFADLLNPGDKVLDIGCGGGIPVTKFLVGEGLEVTGIDVSEKLLAEAKMNVPSAKFIKADIAEYETDQKFEGIVAWDSLFHLEYHQHEPVFKKLFQRLKEGGLLIFTHGGTEGAITGAMHGKNFSYSSLGPEKIKKILENLGFIIIDWVVDQSEPNRYLVAIAQKPT